jgi:hypothetical protein
MAGRDLAFAPRLQDDRCERLGLFMRHIAFLLAVFAMHALAACTQAMTGQGASQARSQFAKCGAENRVTPEGQRIAQRLWMGDGTDTAAKLLDPYPLTPTERAALVQVHAKASQCRDMFMAHVDKNAAWQSPYLQEYVQRSDEIFNKLATGEIAVGMANKLSIESERKLQADLASGHAYDNSQPQGIRTEDAKRERAIEAVLEESRQIAAAETDPRVPTTYCNWLGNTLNCASLR